MNAALLALEYAGAAGGSGTLRMFVAQVLAFILLAAAMWIFVRPALRRILEERSRSIEESFLRLEKETADSARRAAEIEKRLARIDDEERAFLETRRREARARQEALLVESRAQVRSAMERARLEIRIETDKAILEIRRKASELTLKAAEMLVEAAADDAVHQRLVRDTLDRLESVKKP